MATDEAQRAKANLPIALTKFKLGFSKADPDHPDLTLAQADNITAFCSNLKLIFDQCTPQNIQTCREWILKVAAPSRLRLTTLGDYLISLSKSIELVSEAPTAKSNRNRYDIILLMSDVLHHDKFHASAKRPSGMVATVLKTRIEELLKLAYEHASTDSVVEKKLSAVLAFWEVNGIYGSKDIDALKGCLQQTSDGDSGTPIPAEYRVAGWFGDRKAQSYALPASYMLKPLIRRPGHRLRNPDIAAKRFTEVNPSPKVVDLLDEFFENADLRFFPTGDNTTGQTKKYYHGVNLMGQTAKINKETDEQTMFDNGYGWSIDLCEQMKRDGIPEAVKLEREAYEARGPEVDEDMSDDRARSRRRRPSYSSDSSSYRGRPYSRGRHRRRGSRSSNDSRDSHSSSSRDGDRQFRSDRRDFDDDRNFQRRGQSSREDYRNNHRNDHHRESHSNDRSALPNRFQQGQFNQNVPPFHGNNQPGWNPANGSAPNPQSAFPNWNGPHNPNETNMPYGGIVPPPPPPPPMNIPGGYPMQPNFPGQFAAPPLPPPPPPPFVPGAMGGMPGMPNFGGPQANAFPGLPFGPGSGNNHFSNNPNFNNPGGYGGYNQGFNGRGGHQGGGSHGRGNSRGGGFQRGRGGGGYRGH